MEGFSDYHLQYRVLNNAGLLRHYHPHLNMLLLYAGDSTSD